MPGVTRPVFRKHSPAAAQIIADWALIVGPKVASMTTPRRLDRGTLTIGCAGPTAMDLHYVGQELISRINAHLGGQPVHRCASPRLACRRRPARSAAAAP